MSITWPSSIAALVLGLGKGINLADVGPIPREVIESQRPGKSHSRYQASNDNPPGSRAKRGKKPKALRFK
jgi:hypothetical protein